MILLISGAREDGKREEYPKNLTFRSATNQTRRGEKSGATGGRPRGEISACAACLMGLISVEAGPTKEEKRMVEVAETQGERDAPSGIALLSKTQISRALINFNLDVIFRTISEENSETLNST